METRGEAGGESKGAFRLHVDKGEGEEKGLGRKSLRPQHSSKKVLVGPVRSP